MSSEPKNPALLPSGFVDLLPPDAEGEAIAIGVLMKTFASFGYERVKPPLLEFEDSLFAPGPGASLLDQTFRVMDPVSHRMMGLRSDVTAQIARISSTRLGKEPRPLRLCYSNDALRTKASQQRIERQFTQAGCEIVGDADVETDIESCVVALIGLDALGVKKVTIDLAFPKIVTALFDQYVVSEEHRHKFREGLNKRNIDYFKIGAKKLVQDIAQIMKTSGDAKKGFEKLAAMKLSAEISKSVARLKSIYEGVTRAVKELNLDVKITIDPIEHRGFNYYSGFGFTLFADGVAGELGRGGRYDVHFGAGKKPPESAAGFTLYMDTLRKARPAAKKKQVERAAYGDSWAKIRARQKTGVVVVRSKKGKK